MKVIVSILTFTLLSCNAPGDYPNSGGDDSYDDYDYDTSPTSDHWEKQQERWEELQKEWEAEDAACEKKYEDVPALGADRPAGHEGRKVPVAIQYMIPEDLGTDYWVVVESFDNPLFIGEPYRVVAEPGFDANRTGNTMWVPLYLEQQKHYLRAYLRDERTIKPYSFNGMELVEDTPVGVFGALSDITPYKLDYKCPDPVHIQLTHVLKRPPAETGAYLKLKITTPDHDKVTQSAKVRIDLRSENDLAQNPDHTFTIASELLRNIDHPGETETILDNMPLGEWHLHVYEDRNNNKFVDEGELQTTSIKLSFEENKTSKTTADIH